MGVLWWSVCEGYDWKVHREMKSNNRIDEIDLMIIRLLQEDGRRPYANIASELDLSPSTVQQRANRLIDEGLIVIKGAVHPAELKDMVMAMVAIKADGPKLQTIINEIGNLPEVRWVVICAGQYDILAEIVCNDNKHLLSVLSNKLSTIEGIRETVTFPYLEIAKKTYEWKLPE